MPDPRAAQAGPPDDGHLGSRTMPEDVMSVPEADQPARPPHLHTDTPRHSSSSGLGVVLLMLAVVLIAIAGTYAAFRWMP